MNDSSTNCKSTDLGDKTRLAIEETRKSRQRAKSLAEKQSQEKERFKMAKRSFKRKR